jgi:type I restriction enzyme S subunit
MNFTPAEQALFGLVAGDVLVTEGSGSRATVGVSAVWNDDLPSPVCFQNTLLRLRPRDGVTEGRYLAWWARHARSSGQIAAVASGANIQHIGSDGLKRLQVIVPTLQQQRRIADFLDDRVARIDQIITARRQQLAAMEQRFASTRRTAVLEAPGPEKPSDLPWAPRLPVGWPVRRLSQVARMGTGHTPSRSEPDYWVDCRIPWLTTGDVHRFRHDEIDTIDRTALQVSELGILNSAAVLHPARTVALSRTASAGFSVIMGEDMATSQDFVTWTCGPELIPEYLLQLLRVMRPFLLRYLAMGSTHKTIYFPDLMDLRIPLPNLSVQRDAVDKVAQTAERRQSMSAALKAQVLLLQEYKQSLITAAVTGELDVTTAGSGIPG